MSNVYEPGEAEAANEIGTLGKTLLVAVLLLGVIGVLMSLYGGAMMILAQAGLFAANQAQAEMLAEIQAEQSGLALAMSAVQIVVKIGFSTLMAWGALQWLLDSPNRWLRPTLWFGAVFEVAAAGLAALWTLFRWDTVADQFARSMAADPNISPDIANAMGPIFAVTMVATMVGMMFWAFVKAGLYIATNRSLPTEVSGSD